uniref:GST N-terminal domain-containing protein n=1 Tax=Cyanothece sp. (strain PCC 7425 / ATCC 29141) TaxID=395961 RepID=B8HX59_CYAP4
MLKLLCYPPLFGLVDNNPYGLKVATFLNLVGLDYAIEHLMDVSQAPRGQLPFISDDGEIVGDSNQILDYLTLKYDLQLDADLTPAQRDLSLLILRMLDEHLYWIISYSRWSDPNCWPLFKREFLSHYPQVGEEGMEQIRTYNLNRYKFQGIGRYSPAEVYKKGCQNLEVLANLLDDRPFLFGEQPHSIDAASYAFLACIHYVVGQRNKKG